MYPWHERLWQQWIQAFQQNKLPHAIGLAYQPAFGSSELARSLVSLLLCQQPNFEACGSCKGCLLLAAQTHPDFYQIMPIEQKRIGVESIRAVQEKLWLRANQSGAKVILIEQAEQMTEAAANALLKILEEPPQQTYFIVSPERFARLLATVRSRLTLYPMALPSEEMIEHWLIEQGVTDLSEELLKSYQRAPLVAFKQQEQALQPQKPLQSLYEQTEHPVPDHLEEQLLWLDAFLIEVIQAIAVSSTGDSLPQNYWYQRTLQYPQLSRALPIWYDRALNIKALLQKNSLNGRYLLQQLQSSIQLFFKRHS